MKNRAKCKLCNKIIESFHTHDYVSCECGEISIDGGNTYAHCAARDWGNFVRVDDNGNEIQIKVLDKSEIDITPQPSYSPIQTRKEKIDMLEAMVKNLENMPPPALALPPTHYDLYSFLVLVLSILKYEEK